MNEEHKFEEIAAYLEAVLTGEETEDELEELHQDMFNTTYYIVGRYDATQWLGTAVFEVIGQIQEYEMENFGELITDLSEPEEVVNMYVYLIGQRLINEKIEALQ